MSKKDLETQILHLETIHLTHEMCGTVASPANSARNLQTFVQAAIEAKTSENQKKSHRRRKKLQSVPVSFKLNHAPPIQTPAKTRRKRKSKLKNSILHSQVIASKCKFRVRGLVTVEELEDEEEAEEVQSETQTEFSRFGQLQSVAIIREESDRNDYLIGDVVVTFHDEKDAASAFSSYDGVLFGGKTVTCVWETQCDKENTEKTAVVVHGMLTSEELQDPDEFADVEEEMTQIFCNYGEVRTMQICETTGDVTVIFVDKRVANKVVQVMTGLRYGGRLLSASLTLQNGEGAENVECVNDLPVAEPKRVAAPIDQPTESLKLQDLVCALLKRLAALQDRAYTKNPRHDKRSRRLVLGMHEVRRGLFGSKIILLVMATDLDECKAVEEKYAELVSIATEQEVPTLAPMNRRKLGRSLQKSVRVSCVGVYSIEGANDLFQQILQTISR